MLSTPTFVWEEDRWEPLYEAVSSYLDVDSRVEVLNIRLDIIRELCVPHPSPPAPPRPLTAPPPAPCCPAAWTC